MAAITMQEDFDGAESPMTTGVTTFAGTGFSESGGLGTPLSYGADQGIVLDVTHTEDSTNWTTGTIRKVTFDGGFEQGAVWRLVYDYVDASNYRYVKMKWGGYQLFPMCYDDEVELWKVVAGTHSQVTPDTPVPEGKMTAGHLGHYRLQNRDTSFYPSVTIVTLKDLHVVKVSVKDPIHAKDRKDMVVLWATDTRATTSGKGGIYSVAGTQTITVRSIQSQLVNMVWVESGGGGAGTFSSPYAAIATAFPQTTVNEYCVIKLGTYTESIFAPTTSIPSGTMEEDAPCYIAYGAPHVWWKASSTIGCIQAKGAFNHVHFYGIFFDADQKTDTNAVYTWGQSVGGAGDNPKNWYFGKCKIGNCHNKNAFLIGHGTFYTGTTPFDQAPTASEYEVNHFIYDYEMLNGSANTGTAGSGGGGMYNEASGVVTEYGISHDHGENGGRYKYGTAAGVAGVKVTNRNVLRFSRIYNCEQYGWYVGAGTDNIMDFNIVYDCGEPLIASTATGSGLAVRAGAEDTYIRNNIVYRCGKVGGGAGNIAIEEPDGLPIPGPIYLDGNTSYAGKNYGIAILENGGGTYGPVHASNNVDYDNGAGGDFAAEGNTYSTALYNHETVDGDPLFINPDNVGAPNDDDFSFAISSLLRDGGVAQAWSIALDKFRQARPQGGAIDIGAVELASSVPVNQINATYAVSLDVAEDLSLSVVHSSDDMASTATSDAGAWLKTDDPTNVVIS